MEPRICFGIPSNERLCKPSLALLQAAELPIQSKSRNYRGIGEYWDRLDAFFLRAGDVARLVAAGSLDMGITTEEVLEEQELDIRVVCPLDFSFSKIVVASDKINTIEDLAYKTVATSFTRIAENYFEKQGIPGVKVLSVQGTVEAFPTLGLCDAIVDLVETGETIRANGLHIIAEIRKQQAILVAKPFFNDTRELDLQFIQRSLVGAIKAKKHRWMYCFFPDTSENLEKFYVVMNKYAASVVKLRDIEKNRFKLVVAVSMVSRIMRVLYEQIPQVEIELHPIGLLFGDSRDIDSGKQ